MREVAIVAAARTPIGNFGGALKNVPAYELSTIAIKEAVRRANVAPSAVDLVILGQNYQSGEYVNIARQSILKAGWPESVPGISLDRRCPSGFDAICMGQAMIQSENADIVLAGGVESMSTAEFYIKGDVRWGVGGSGDMPKGMGSIATWGIPFYDRIERARVMSQPEERYGIVPTMMTWAESAAKECAISRAECDQWALSSNKKACNAITSGKFKDESIPVPLPGGRGQLQVFEQDEHPRPDTSFDALAKLRPVLGGVCTAGNSAGQNDGSAACVLMGSDKAKELGIKPLAYIRSFAWSGVDPRETWKAVPIAVSKALAKAGLALSQIDLIEIHEAFAAQVLANFKGLGLTEKDYARVNVNGSCISLGHPLGATGARILTTLIYEMQRRGARYGLIAICGGGGMGAAGVIERV